MSLDARGHSLHRYEQGDLGGMEEVGSGHETVSMASRY